MTQIWYKFNSTYQNNKTILNVYLTVEHLYNREINLRYKEVTLNTLNINVTREIQSIIFMSKHYAKFRLIIEI